MDLTQDDMLALWNMKNLKKHLIDLPSIGGNANLSGNQVHIMYRSGGGMESIGVNFFTLKKILEEALPSFN
ncbi:hypothetical protein DLM_2683 [Aquitalea magnusonii]|uniref:Uncharacterized protein n=1 Tax=Aquitalea magnusonii TaxID=332411 RepID=A0A3G9GFY9_9NEIS|nr:hypothetical protein DLM_2683 [Aquitalea magnusonii]